MLNLSIQRVVDLAWWVLILLLPISAVAQTFATVDAYVEQLSGRHQILESRTASVDTSSGKRIFGIVCWSLEATNPGGLDTAQSSVFVVERVGNGIRELGRSQPFDFTAKVQRALELTVEATSNDKFKVSVLLQSSGVGSIEYRFVERRNTWYLAGLERWESSMYVEDGDEALGDTRTEWSTNFLTGRTITKTFRGTKLVSVVRRKQAFPQFSLEQFQIFDPRHDEQ